MNPTNHPNAADYLIQQQQIYAVPNTLPRDRAPFSIHPVSGTWQNSPHLRSRYAWGGGATVEACDQIEAQDFSHLGQIAVLTFGPVQSFLGGGQRLRDWAVGSWLCHYLSAVLIYRWQAEGGHVLLPLHQSSPLLNWLNGNSCDADLFWQAELPNVITGLCPDDQWLKQFENTLNQEWERFTQHLENATINYSRHLGGVGWRTIHADNQYQWTVYAESAPYDRENLQDTLATLHQRVEARKLGRGWQGTWWGGPTSPSAGNLSIWHPGLRQVDRGGTWGLPRQQLDQWWQSIAQKSKLSGLFSESDRLNSIELVKRLASVPDIIEPTLQSLWPDCPTPPSCPWERFPDRSAIAATWIVDVVRDHPEVWNHALEPLKKHLGDTPPKSAWGMPQIDNLDIKLHHPRVLERRNIPEDHKTAWDRDSQRPQGWESTIEWTVGWRGDGDNMGKWLAGDQYTDLNLPWSNWHPTPEQKALYNLDCDAPSLPRDRSRQLELPHTLDLSILFNKWNRLLYPLVQDYHQGKVIFAGGDDFLLLGPLTECVPLTNDLYHLWRGETSPITQPLDSFSDGWVQYGDEIYPVPGQKMDFSLGIVIAQRRIPQSLWHRGLNQAYKAAKEAGRNRVCVRVLFNSGQSLQWICPWELWELLMPIEPDVTGKTALNRWEKLLAYVESTRLRNHSSVRIVGELFTPLLQSVGIPLDWPTVERVGRSKYASVINNWQWWLDWISLKAFLARQQREREKWVQSITKTVAQTQS